MNLITLCSGIGAPEIAASWLRWKHLLTCEIAPFCNRVLEYQYTEAYNHHDIKTLNHEIIERELSARFGDWRSGGTVLVAGFPCQPFSCAGKRLGASDDRYLWDEVKRILAEIKPDWFIGENVAGILSMVLPGNEVKVGSYKDIAGESYEEIEVREQSVVEHICIDLESIGYSVIPFVIPACAVGAPHRRDRVWFVANRTDAGIETQQREGKDGVLSCETATHTDLDRRRERKKQQVSVPERQRTTHDCPCGKDGASPHPDSQRREKLHASPIPEKQGKRASVHAAEIPNWEHFPATQPAIRGGDDGNTLGLFGITFPKWRTESIKALGNSMVPQILYEIFLAIEQTHEQNTTENRQGTVRTCQD